MRAQSLHRSRTDKDMIMGRLDNKVAVITGAASGIGEATARRFVAEGAKVVIADMQEELGEQVAGDLGASATFIPTNVAKESDVKAAVDEAANRWGRLDVIFNNAGFGGAMGSITETSEADYDMTMDVLLKGVIVDEATYRGTLDSPKTERSNRTVKIGPIVRRVLDEWRRTAPFTGSSDFVFSIRTNSPINLKNAVGRHVKPACRSLGIPAVSWHDLRHTYTTWGRRAGVRAESMRDQLGHSSVTTTLDIYSHVDSQDDVAEAIEAYCTQGKLLPLSVTPEVDDQGLTH